MKHQIKQVFSSPKFVIGFIIFMAMLLTSIFYPMISSVGPLQSVFKGSNAAPGTYVNVEDVIKTEKGIFELPVAANRIDNALSEKEKDKMIKWLENYGGVEEGILDKEDMPALISTWNANFDPTLKIAGMLTADRKEYQRIDTRIKTVLNEAGVVIAEKNADGELVESSIKVGTKDFVNVNEVANTITFPLGTDNFGRDILTELTSAILTSIKLGFIAGIVATAIGLILGLLAGYLGGLVDNIITFITNIFTVIPGFVLLILISYSISPSARGVTVVAVVIGLTAWPWTTRSVRSQVISLRNRDHVNLSKLSGHSMPRIIATDILPYIASYVVMALILQISSGILAEAQLSMLGLGPSTTEVATLGLMMNWSQTSSSWQTGAWWAFIPVILSIALVSFSLNLMNTGLDQVFNPQLRDS